MTRRKTNKIAERLADLRALTRKFGLEVWEFPGNSYHHRVIGKNPIDYWPGKGTIWPLESRCAGFKGTPADVCELASFDW